PECGPALPELVFPPTIRVTARREPAAVTETEGEPCEVEAAGNGHGPCRIERGSGAELPRVVVSPAVRDAVHRKRAGMACAAADREEFQATRHHERRSTAWFRGRGRARFAWTAAELTVARPSPTMRSRVCGHDRACVRGGAPARRGGVC